MINNDSSAVAVWVIVIINCYCFLYKKKTLLFLLCYNIDVNIIIIYSPGMKEDDLITELITCQSHLQYSNN